MRVAIVGCGLIGKRRATIVSQTPGDEVTWVIDVDMQRAKSLAKEIGCEYSDEWQTIVLREDVDTVIVATPNKYLMPVSIAALQAGKHVLCEKPPGRNFIETQLMEKAAHENRKILKVGFNHRHHPAIQRAYLACCTNKEIGEILFLRAIYGHGGRPGYEKEWRGDAELSGGGELLDQGVHIIDLFQWFIGKFSSAFCFTATMNWNLGFFVSKEFSSGNKLLQLEDNAFALLQTKDGKVAQFHTSWTQWKNRFSFEVFGSEGFVRVEGLGGSYGIETLTIGHRRSEGGAPVEQKIEFTGADLSWQEEWREFRNAISEERQPLANIVDGLNVMSTVSALYHSARTGQKVEI